jgi:uncharacterized membrane protein/protein-disulfide isomerase
MLLLRGLGIVGLAVSAASLADQSVGDGTFCGFKSGCQSVTSSAYGSVLGVPLSVVGLLGFGTVLGFSLIGGVPMVRLTRWAAGLGAVVGLVLIVIQAAVLNQFCELCLIADSCAIAMGIVCVRPLPVEPPSSAMRGITAVLGVLAVGAPLMFAYMEVKPDPPDWVKAHWVPDKITIVEVTDFECEHCRRADEYVREALKGRDDVKLVRIAVEMPKHIHSRTAAIAFRAAQAQGREKDMAEALFASPALTAHDCRALAEKLGLNMAEYDRVATDPATDKDVSAAGEAAKAFGPGVPLIWIQSDLNYGMPGFSTFDEPLGRARPHRAK